MNDKVREALKHLGIVANSLRSTECSPFFYGSNIKLEFLGKAKKLHKEALAALDNGWVSVDIAPPSSFCWKECESNYAAEQDKHRYLVYAPRWPYEGVFEATATRELDGGIIWIRSSDRVKGVSHWRPLPDPPEE